MKALALLMALVSAPQVASAADIEPTPIEPEAIISDGISRDALYALAGLTRLYGYRCDSISGAVQMIFSNGFTLYCNYHRYEYEIEDKGGNWIVTVQ